MNRPASILFVCLGNICRSPLAEAALRVAASEAGIRIETDSAGTGGWHAGEPPDPRAQAVARRHGVDIARMHARQVDDADFRRFVQIFALDRDNLAALQAIAPADATAALGLLLDCVPGREGQGVHDPYYGPDAGFEQTWNDVAAAAAQIVRQWRA
jgi:protein-tyrosine phosphatase